MRTLHAVSMKERFVASGAYHFYKGDQARKGTEYWSIHEQGDGSLFIRIDLDLREREYDPESWLVEVLLHAQTRRVERFDLHLYNTQGVLKQNLVFFEDYVQIGYSLNHGERQYQERPLPEHYALALGTNLLFGLAIAQISRQIQVEVPTFFSFDVFDPEFEFEPCIVLSDKGDDSLTIAGQTLACRKYQFDCGGQGYVWLDEYGIMLQKDIPDRYRVMLSAYARRPEEKEQSR